MSRYTYVQVITGFLNLVKPVMARVASLPSPSHCSNQKPWTGVVYKGTRFYNGDRALKVKRWLHRVAEDASGLTFEEWDPTKDVDNSQPPVAMIINSSELRGAGFNLQEVIPPALEAAARSGRRTRGAGVRQVEGLGRKRFVLSADDDNDLRSRCE